MELMTSKFDESYYKTGNYINYLSRQPRYEKLALEISDLIKNKNNKILDYGCAIGFLINGLRKIGYRNLSGYEISDWCLKQLKKTNIQIEDSGNFDTIICLDVLEHMSDIQIDAMMRRFSSKQLIVRIPVSIDRKRFYTEIANNDPTHINCKTKNDWISLLKKYNYQYENPIIKNTIYDSTGVLCATFLKE